MKEENLSMKKKVFGSILILLSLAVIFYFSSKILSNGFEDISSIRFILGGIFIFVLAIALFKDKVNTKPMGAVLLAYFILDAFIVIINSKSITANLIFEIVFIIIIIYFIFRRKK